MSALAWQPPADLVGKGTRHVAVGDLIRTGENLHPHYQIIAMTDDRAWLRDTQHGTDHMVPIDRCRRI
ncbi:MAG: hypothetical protein ABI454_10120 [Sphingomicrobium sp.]